MRGIMLRLLVPILLLASPLFSQEIPHSVVASGGDELGGSGYDMLATVGQTFTGEMSNSSHDLLVGYWYHPGPVISSVFLVSFGVERRGDQVIVRWEVVAAVHHAGFHVWRQEPARERVRITHQLLSEQSYYEFVDVNAPPSELEYWLEEVGQDGASIWLGPVFLTAIPLVFQFDQNRPNPFNPMTTLTYSSAASWRTGSPGPTAPAAAMIS